MKGSEQAGDSFHLVFGRKDCGPEMPCAVLLAKTRPGHDHNTGLFNQKEAIECIGFNGLFVRCVVKLCSFDCFCYSMDARVMEAAHNLYYDVHVACCDL